MGQSLQRVGVLWVGTLKLGLVNWALNQYEWGLINAVVGQIWVVIFLPASPKKPQEKRESLVFRSLNHAFSHVMVLNNCSFFFCRELMLLNQSKNKSCTKKCLKKAKISHPWKNNERGMWITQHFLWLVDLSHTITIKWLTCLYPSQKGFFAFSRGSAVQPTTQFYYFVLAILVLRYSNPFPLPPRKYIFQAKVQSEFQCDYTNTCIL